MQNTYRIVMGALFRVSVSHTSHSFGNYLECGHTYLSKMETMVSETAILVSKLGKAIGELAMVT